MKLKTKKKAKISNSKFILIIFSLTLQEKIHLTERVRKLSNEGLAAFVRLVQKECPSAFEDLDAEKVQVRVDYLDKPTFGSLQNLLDSYLLK